MKKKKKNMWNSAGEPYFLEVKVAVLWSSINLYTE